MLSGYRAFVILQFVAGKLACAWIDWQATLARASSHATKKPVFNENGLWGIIWKSRLRVFLRFVGFFCRGLFLS